MSDLEFRPGRYPNRGPRDPESVGHDRDLDFRAGDYAHRGATDPEAVGRADELEFHPEHYVRDRMPPRRRRRGWAPGAGQSSLLALGLGLAAGAAALYYYNSEDRGPRRYRDSAPRLARRERTPRHVITGRTVTINKPRSELYSFWRDPKNLTFMENVERIEAVAGDAKRQRWSIAAPGGRTVTVETEITEDRPNELIAWRSTPDSQIETIGHVEFRDGPGKRGTEVSAVIEYVPPGGALGRMVAKLFQREPQVQVRRDLKRLKMLMETGEIATSQMRKYE